MTWLRDAFLIPAAAALALAGTPAHAAPGEDHWTIETAPADAARLAEAQGLIDAERFAEALPLLEALALDLPANADVANLLGFAHRKLGNLEAGAAAYRRALHLEPDHLGALEYQGELFLTLGDRAAAEANLARLRSLCPSPCEETDDLAEAIATFEAGQD